MQKAKIYQFGNRRLTEVFMNQMLDSIQQIKSRAEFIKSYTDDQIVGIEPEDRELLSVMACKILDVIEIFETQRSNK